LIRNLFPCVRWSISLTGPSVSFFPVNRVVSFFPSLLLPTRIAHPLFSGPDRQDMGQPLQMAATSPPILSLDCITVRPSCDGEKIVVFFFSRDGGRILPVFTLYEPEHGTLFFFPIGVVFPRWSLEKSLFF